MIINHDISLDRGGVVGVVKSMLLVKTKIGPSKIHGIGLFADQFISKGTLIWQFTPDFDLIIDEDQIADLSEPAKEQFLNYAYLHPKNDKYILVFDDARFMNHSGNPNILSIFPFGDVGETDVGIAARDISVGDELTCDYRKFAADFDYNMGA